MPSTVEQIKSRLSIADVVSSYIKLERAGANFRALCPFHNEKTASFMVSPARESYYCFGCNRGGDIFTFVQEIEGMEFRDALKTLADRAGVAIVYEKQENRSERETFEKLLEAATVFFERALPHARPIEEYLVKRGVSPAMRKFFRIGFAPDEWRALFDYLKKAGFKDDDMEKSGMAIRSPKGLYDRFRGRIMFPITDGAGKTIAFSGRAIGSDYVGGKYINSPATLLYDKSRALFAFDKAKLAIREKDECVLVEGQFDAVLSHGAGVTNTVALSGTALTEHHLQTVKRFTNNLVMAFDTDAAGRAAFVKGVSLALSLDMNVKRAVIPEGLDPADLILKNPDSWREAVHASKHIIDSLIDDLKERVPDPRERKLGVSRNILPYIRRIKNEIDKAHFIGRVVEELFIPDEIVWAEVRKKDDSAGVSPGRRPEAPVPHTVHGTVRERLTGVILWQRSKQVPDILLEKLEMDIKSIIPDFTTEHIPAPEKIRLIFEAERHGEPPEGVTAGEWLGKEITGLLVRFRSEGLKLRLKKIKMELTAAERTKDTEETRRKMAEFNALSNQLALMRSDKK
jgi:DNA primase